MVYLPSRNARWRPAHGAEANGNTALAAIPRPRGTRVRARDAHVRPGLPASRAVGFCCLSPGPGYRARGALARAARIKMALPNLKRSLLQIARSGRSLPGDVRN